MALSYNARGALVGVVGAAAAFLVFRGADRGSVSGDPVAAVPKGSFLAATVDVAALRRSPLYGAIAGKEARALGIGALAESCGFDPTARVERLAIAVPEDGDKGAFGVAAHVEVSRDELERCARALGGERGERAENGEKTAAHKIGSFVVLEGPRSESRVAYGRGGLLVVGRGGWFDAMLATAERRAPGLADAPEHAALRASLTGREGWRAPTLVATAVLPRSLRDRLRSQMAGEDAQAGTMASVLGVSSVGVAIKAGGPGGLVEATLDLICDSPEACRVVDELIQTKRFGWAKDLSLRLVGLGPVLDAVEVKREGARVRATTTASADAVAAALERTIRLRGRREPSMDAILGAAPRADETVRPDGGARHAGDRGR